MAAAVVVKAVVPGWLSHPRRVSFPDRTLLDREILAGKLADAFALQPGSFRLAYRDDDNDLIELGTAADLSECIDFFSYGGSSNASSAALPSSRASVANTVTLRIEVIVEYDGPALSEAGTGTGIGTGGRGSQRLTGTGGASSTSGAGTTISSAATDREGALARWKAEQDALAVQFSRLVSRSTAQRFPPEDERFAAADEAIQHAMRAAEERNRDRRVWTIEQEAVTLHAARAGLAAAGRDQDNAAYTRRRYSGNDASSMGDWVRERAYDVAHGLDGGSSSSSTDALSVSDAGLRDDHIVNDDDDDDDWDRETVSSFIPFGGASRLPPGVRNGTGDSGGGDAALGPRDDEALHPNFASHFVIAEPVEHFWQAPVMAGTNGSNGLSQQHQRPIPGHHQQQQQQQQQQWNSSPMFSSPGSSMYSIGGSGQEADSVYKPTGSERARVEALFAPSEYGGSSGGGGGPEMSAEADHRVAAAGPSWLSGDATPSSSQASIPLQSTATDDDEHQATPPAAGRASPTLPTASATVVNPENDSGDFTCAVCMDVIDGVRYLCIQCNGYSLCETCETDPNAKLASRRRKQNSSTIGSAFSTLGGRTQRENEYIPMLHDSNHVLLKIKPGATLPGGFGRLGSGRVGGGNSSRSTPPAPIAPPVPPLSRPTTPLPYVGRVREIPVRLPADGPTRLTRPEPLGRASSGGEGTLSESHSSSSSSSTGPPCSQLVPPIRIPAVSIPGFSVPGGASVAPVQIPEINIPAVNFPTISHPVISTTPTTSKPIPAPVPVPPRVMPFAVQPASFRRFDNVVERNHGVGCSHCGKLIPTGAGEEGVRWLCGNCPTVPGYNLCSDCELESASIHDPSHAFLRLTHRLRRPLPSLNSGLVPLLYLPKQDGHEARAEGKENGVVASRDQAGGTTQEGGKHAMIVCDACGQKITDAWMLCCHCPVSFDLCRPCLVERDASTLARHNPSHVFLGLKEPVDLELLKQVTRFSSRRPRGLIEWDLYS